MEKPTLESTYNWRNCKLTSLQDIIEGPVSEYLGGINHVAGWIAQDDGSHLTIDSFENFFSTLNEEVDRAKIRCHGSNDLIVCFRLYLNSVPPRMHFYIEYPNINSISEARALCEKMVRLLNLEDSDPAGIVEYGSRYKWKHLDPKLLRLAVEQVITPYLGSKYRFRGTLEQRNKKIERLRFDVLSDCLNQLNETFYDDVYLRFEAGSRTVVIQAWHSEITISVESAPTDSSISSTISDSIAQLLCLETFPERSAKSESVNERQYGRHQRYLTHDSMNRDIVVSILSNIRDLDEDFHVITATLRRRDATQNEESIRNLDIWCERVQTLWDKLLQFSTVVWTDDNSIEVAFTCLPWQDVIEIGVMAPSESDATNLIDKLAAKLNLIIISDPQFGQARIEGNFNILDWSSEKFVAAVNTASKLMFAPREPFVEEAQIIRSNGLIEKYQKLEKLLGRIKTKPERFRRIDIALLGPRGSGLGIHVENHLQQLVILTSQSSEKELKEVTQVFSKRLTIKPDTQKDIPSDLNTSTKKSTRINIFIPIIVGLIGLTGTLISPFFSKEFIEASRPKTAIMITNPSKNTKLMDGDFLVEWTVTVTHWWKETKFRDQIATIRVWNGGDLYLEVEAKPGHELSLPVGDFELEVIDPETSMYDRIETKVPNSTYPISP